MRQRKYSAAFAGSPDFTLMFVPADPILDAAMDVQPALWDEAWSKHRVLIATPRLTQSAITAASSGSVLAAPAYRYAARRMASPVT